MKKLILLFAAAFAMSCNNEKATEKISQNEVRISGEIENSDSPYFIISNLSQTFSDTIYISDDNTFQKNISLENGEFFMMFYSQQFLELYLAPNNSVEINVKDNSLINAKFEGSLKDVEELLLIKQGGISMLKPQELLQLEPVEFAERMAAFSYDINNIIDSSKVESDLKEIIKADVFYSTLPLRDGYAKRKGEEIASIENFNFFHYQERIAKDINNPVLLGSNSFKVYLFNYLQTTLMTEYRPQIEEAGDEWVVVVLNNINNIYENDDIADTVLKTFYNSMVAVNIDKLSQDLFTKSLEAYVSNINSEETKAQVVEELKELQKKLK